MIDAIVALLEVAISYGVKTLVLYLKHGLLNSMIMEQPLFRNWDQINELI